MATSSGMKYYLKATSSLYASGDIKFDLEPHRLLSFMEKVEARAIDFGWTGIFKILNPTTGQNDDFLQRHGRISLDDVVASESTYIGANNSRLYQCSIHLQSCIYKSLTEAAQGRVRGDRDSYTINGEKAGVAYLKVVLLRTTPASNSNVNHIRRQLADLHTYMKTINSDVEKFNSHVTDLRDNLALNGAVTHDLLINLFKGYQAASDKPFVDYIKRKSEKHDDGTGTVTEGQLMTDAENYYKSSVRDETWNVPDENQQAILSLQAELKAIKGKKKTPPKKPGNPKKTPKKQVDVPAWRTVAPSEEDKLKPKMHPGDPKPWYWCEKLSKFCRHKPDECGKNPKTNEQKRVKLQAALAATYAGSDSDYESASESSQEE